MKFIDVLLSKIIESEGKKSIIEMTNNQRERTGYGTKDT
jgi:hypothetical protein